MCVKRWGYTNEPKSGLAGSGLPTWPHVKADLMQYIFPGEERQSQLGSVWVQPLHGEDVEKSWLSLWNIHSVHKVPRLLAIFLTGKFSKSPET